MVALSLLQPRKSEGLGQWALSGPDPTSQSTHCFTATSLPAGTIVRTSWLDLTPMTDEGFYHGRVPHASGVIAFRRWCGALYVCLRRVRRGPCQEEVGFQEGN